MDLLGIHHVALNVDELEQAVSFYERVLGLTRRRDRPEALGEGAWLSAGSFEVHLSVGDLPTRVGQHFALTVRDFDAAWETIRLSGAAAREPQPSGDGAVRQCYVADPAGNWVEIRERSST
jgi:glyoxylase I family protein